MNKWIVWCDLNIEQDKLEKLLKGYCVSVKGDTPIEKRLELEKQWREGDIPVMITKPSCYAYGMNWQHCHNVIFVGLSDSFEQYYQAIRRFWRFGQKNDVTVDLVLSDGQSRVIKALKEKTKKAEQLYENLVKNVNSDFRLDIKKNENVEVKIPSFLRGE